ncbi:hypothetical protein MMC26_005446 [Xylographa opegraphella]|nr:hypothetical protein [Xylographa opegraphella]
MGNECSHEIAPRGSDLIDIHQGLLYTVLEFIFTHAASPGALAAFISSCPWPGLPGLPGYPEHHDKACDLLGLFALVAHILPADDFAAAFVEPQPSDWVAEYLAAAGEKNTRVCDDPRLRLRDRDLQLLGHMQHESKRLYREMSLRNARCGWSTLSARTERQGRVRGRTRYITVAGAYHVMNGDAKLEAVRKALALLASLVQHADLGTVFRKITLPRYVRRFVHMLPPSASQRREIFTLSRLVGTFEAEEARLLGIKRERASRAQAGHFLWPRWGTARPRPARTSHAPLLPSCVKPEDTVSHERAMPNTLSRGTVDAKALWKSGDLNVLRILQGVARIRALRRGGFSTTWSFGTSILGGVAPHAGIGSARAAAAAGRGSGVRRFKEGPNATFRTGLAVRNDPDGDGSDSDKTVMGSCGRAAASDDVADAGDGRIPLTENCLATFNDAQQFPDNGHQRYADHAWDDSELYSADDAVSSPTPPQLEAFPAGMALSGEWAFTKLLYSPAVRDVGPEEAEDAWLLWTMDDVEDVGSAGS